MEDNKPRPGQADTRAVQPDPEAIRRPDYDYEEQEQGIRHIPDPEETDHQDRGLVKKIHQNPDNISDEAKD